jgi:hypothetical protein
VNLERGDPYAVLSSTPSNASLIFRTVSNSIVLLHIGQRDFVSDLREVENAITR